MSRCPVVAVAVCILAGAAAARAMAAGDAMRGADLATTCLGCHGIPGARNGYPSYRVPMLGGQQQDYTVAALQGYRNSQRAHSTMQAHASTMSDQDMRDLAAYFASQGEPRAPSGASAGPQGPLAEKVALCTACHGEAGISPAPAWPNLAGQHEDYLVHTMQQYRNGERKDPVMAGEMAVLTESDIRALAAYYASRPGLFTADYSVARK